jgi:restriction endonuclease
MARTTAQVKGDALEDAVRILEMVILGVDPNAIDSPITIERKKIIFVQGVKHEIDIYITINNGKGYTSTFIFECKNWQAKIDPKEIMAFALKVRDVRASKGFFIAKRFTKYAIAQAKRDGIELLTADDVIDTLPPFLDDFHILGNTILTHETSTNGVNPCDQTSVQVKLCCSESGPPQIPQEAHTRGWNVTASYCTHPR